VFLVRLRPLLERLGPALPVRCQVPWRKQQFLIRFLFKHGRMRTRLPNDLWIENLQEPVRPLLLFIER
jgi:hypothetical protein